MSALAERVDKFFKITERGSTLRIELWAAVANFTANAYLLVLVPELLAAAGVKRSASLFGFVVATFVSSSIVGLVGNLPVAMGPGTGAATYFSIHFAGSDPRLGLTVCFLSGVLMFLLAAFNLPRRLFDYCPFSVKNAMPMGLGLYLSLCGLQKLGIVVAGNGLVLGDVAEPSVIVGMMGILLMVYMEHLRSDLKFLVPITIAALASWATGLAPGPTALLGGAGPEWPTPVDLSLVQADEYGVADADADSSSSSSLSSSSSSSSFGAAVAGPTLAFFVIALFDVAGIMYACADIAGLVSSDPSVGVPGAYWVFVSAGAASLLSAVFSCTPTIVFGESFAGVLAGGRTGLTAFGMAVLFVLTLPLHPVLEAVPLFASAPVLVVLGSQLLALIPASCARKLLDFDDLIHGFPSFVTIVGMPFLAGIEKGIGAGLAAWAALQVIDLGWRGALRCLATAEACRGAGAPSAAEQKALSGASPSSSSYQAVRLGEGGEFQPLSRTNTMDSLSEGMPPRTSSFKKSPGPGVFPNPYEVSRAAAAKPPPAAAAAPSAADQEHL